MALGGEALAGSGPGESRGGVWDSPPGGRRIGRRRRRRGRGFGGVGGGRERKSRRISWRGVRRRQRK